jgi:PAS domain S-box-containing protein
MDTKKPEWLQQMENILETLNVGVLLSDHTFRTIFVNSVFEEMTGISREELVGKDAVRDYYSREDWEIISARRAQTRDIGRGRDEFFLPRKDGTRLPVVISARRLNSPEGDQLTIATFTEISELKKTEVLLRAANQALEERQKEIDDDLRLSARVQQSLAPKSVGWKNIQVEAVYKPARSIGGDFGLVRSFDDNNLNLLLGDISGHGIGSALVANRIYSEALTQLQNGVELDVLLRQLNDFAINNLDGATLFFTLAVARVNPSARRIYFAGAGHPPMMLIRPNELPYRIESRSTLLGALPNAIAEDAIVEIEFKAGDRVLLYTDGLTDVFDAAGEILGVDGLSKIVSETATLPFVEVSRGILDRIASYGDGPPADDISFILMQFD